MFRKILIGLGAALLIVVAWNGSLLLYGINQGVGQLKIVWNAHPIEDYLNDPFFPDSLKSKLRLIDEIREYAIDSLGLNDTENYHTLFDQKGEEVMWVVTACEPFRLESKTWDFPVVGSVPYKGYFNQEKAIREGEKLKGEGWDVSIRNPGGWSTLGWFTDPILSGMLERNEGDLASLIIHEMVHATIFVKDSVEFNENLASFIADTAAYQFLAYHYGRHSGEYEQYVKENDDYRTYSNFILRASDRLAHFYESFLDEESTESKEKKKRTFISQIVKAMDTLALVANQNPSKRFADQPPNNTYFMSYRQYQSKQGLFRMQLDKEFNGDLRRYIDYLEGKFPFL